MKRDASLIRLSRDHHRGLALAQHIERALPGAGREQVAELRKLAVDFWTAGLLPHFRSECECLVARLVRHAGLDSELIRRTQRDHLSIHAMLNRLRDDTDMDEGSRVLGDVAALLREHIRWEESVLFEAAQRLLDARELSRLGDDLASRLPEVPPAPPWYRRDSADAGS